MMLAGRKRFGKTSGIRFFAAQLKQEFPGLADPAVFICPPYERFSGEFFTDLLEALHADATKGRKADKRGRIVDLIRSQAAKSQLPVFVIFVDEAQNLLERHYKWLIWFSNILSRKGVDLVIALVGQDELFSIRQSFLQGRQKGIIGRFMTVTAEFHGIKSESQMRSCLECYDTESEYPAGSGWSFTKYYFPAAFSSGWRLSSLTNDLWATFRAASKTATNKDDREVPMMHFCRTVEQLILSKSTISEIAPSISREDIEAAVAESGYPAEFQYGQAGGQP